MPPNKGHILVNIGDIFFNLRSFKLKPLKYND